MEDTLRRSTNWEEKRNNISVPFPTFDRISIAGRGSMKTKTCLKHPGGKRAVPVRRAKVRLGKKIAVPSLIWATVLLPSSSKRAEAALPSRRGGGGGALQESRELLWGFFAQQNLTVREIRLPIAQLFHHQIRHFPLAKQIQSVNTWSPL